MNAERREVIELLSELSSLYPEMRIGQLLTWFAGAARGPRPESIYDAEDDEVIAVMRSHLSQKRAERETSAASN